MTGTTHNCQSAYVETQTFHKGALTDSPGAPEDWLRDDLLVWFVSGVQRGN